MSHLFFFEDLSLFLLQSFSSQSLLYYTSSISLSFIFDFLDLRVFYNQQRKKCVVAKAVLSQNNGWKSVVQLLFKILHPKALNIEMIEHLVQQTWIIFRGRSLFLLVYVVRAYVYKQTECVIGLVSLRKKRKQLGKKIKFFVMRHVFC